MVDVGLHAADMVTVAALAQLQLCACRHGGHVRLRHASHELLALLELCGLGDLLRDGEPGSG